ncbi:MAG: restriction endonuclease subunit S [Methylococcaceae bacterium]
MVHKGFKQIQGLSICPIEWQVVQANKICSKITKGTTPSKSEIVENSNVPFLRVNNLTFEGKLNKKNELLFVTEFAHRGILARSIAYPNDILMNIVGPPLGKVILLPDTFSEYNLNQAIIIYRTNAKDVDVIYFLCYLKSHYAQLWLSSRSKKTSGQQNLTIELCKELPVPLPSLPEQKKIAKILSTWDNAIEKLEALIAAKRKRIKALMQQLLIGKMRIEGFDGEWKEVRLKELLHEIKRERVENPENLELLTVRLHCKGVIRSKKYPATTNQGRPYFIRKEGELIIGRQNLHNGGIGIVTREVSGCIASNAISSFETKNGVSKNFLLYRMSMPSFLTKVDNLIGGTGQKEISVNELLKIKINAPLFNEQQKIATVLSTADKEITIHTTQLAALKQQKKGLMQQLLTGKKRVNATQVVA